MGVQMNTESKDISNVYLEKVNPPSKALPNTINPYEGDPYDGAELKPFDGRPGAMDAFRLPSRGLI